MSKLFQLVIPPLVFISVSTVSLVEAVESESTEEVCEPVGRLVSGLNVEEGAELLCAGTTLPVSDMDTTVRAICFTSNSVEEVEIKQGEALTVAEVCRPSHAVVPCGDGVCFAPRGDIFSIEISLEESSEDASVTLLDWNDVPGSERYLIQVFDGPEKIFVAQESVSEIETMLELIHGETVSVTAISPTQFIIGYGRFLMGEENEGRPVDWMIER